MKHLSSGGGCCHHPPGEHRQTQPSENRNISTSPNLCFSPSQWVSAQKCPLGSWQVSSPLQVPFPGRGGQTLSGGIQSAGKVPERRRRCGVTSVGSERSGISPKEPPGALRQPWRPVPAQPGEGCTSSVPFLALQRLMGRFSMIASPPTLHSSTNGGKI